MGIKQIKMNFDGTGDVFPFVRENKALVEQIRRTIPDCGLWFDKRPNHQNELRKFCGDDENKRQLVTELLSFNIENRLWEDSRATGGSSEYRTWPSLGRPQRLLEIENLAADNQELFLSNLLVQKATPEIQLPFDYERYHTQIEFYYKTILAGAFKPYWPFRARNPQD